MNRVWSLFELAAKGFFEEKYQTRRSSLGCLYLANSEEM